MAKRPNIFSQPEFENSLREQGCTESFVNPITSDFKLFVPIILWELGEENVFQIVESARTEIKLREQEAAWRKASKGGEFYVDVEFRRNIITW